VVAYYDAKKHQWEGDYYSGQVKQQDIVQPQQLSRRRHLRCHVATKVVFPDGGHEVLVASLFAVHLFILCVQWLEEKKDYERFCHAEDFYRMQEEGLELSAKSRCLGKEVEDWRRMSQLRQEQWKRVTGASRSIGLEW
jgi:hypothetical protein